MTDLWSPVQSTAPLPPWWQLGGQAAEGPEAALWTVVRRLWSEDTVPGGNRAKAPAEHRYTDSRFAPRTGWSNTDFGTMCLTETYENVMSSTDFKIRNRVASL